MSLRKLSRHQTEAKYANNWSDSRDSSKAAKHKQYAINQFHRAVRRAQADLIAEQLDSGPTIPPFRGRVYHSESFSAAEPWAEYMAAQARLRFGSY